MFVDIHSHKFPAEENIVIYNVPTTEVEAVFASEMKGCFSFGFHPWSIEEDFSADRLDKMRIFSADRRLAAIGECGLDKNAETPLKKQIEVFEAQVRLSEEMRKPLIIHCVGRFNELFDLRKQWKPRQTWIVHGFRGKVQLAEQVLKAGCKLSFGEHFNPESVRITPVDSLFVETDESNLPVEEIYERIAAAKSCPVGELTAGKQLVFGL